MLHRVRWFFILCSILLVCSCGGEKLSPLSASDTILCFGDSLTAGVGASRETSYPSVLSSLTGLNVVNAGISGEETSGGLKRFASVVEQHQPALIILMEGGNDILRNRNLAQTKANLSEMIQIAKSQAIPVVLIGVPEKKLFSDSSPLYRELAEEFDLIFAEDLLADLLRKVSYKSDAIHLNDAGYQVMAEQIFELLQENGAL